MLPESPGCYLMKDREGTVIYVGKAVNLKNRVRSYFRDTAHTPKVAAMIAHIDDFDILLCETNLEALILECNLIKLHKPYYNILLKDDKHYPYLKVDMRQPYPRLELCRRMEKDGAKYFGPYIGANAVRQPDKAAAAAADSRKSRRPRTPALISHAPRVCGLRGPGCRTTHGIRPRSDAGRRRPSCPAAACRPAPGTSSGCRIS